MRNSFHSVGEFGRTLYELKQHSIPNRGSLKVNHGGMMSLSIPKHSISDSQSCNQQRGMKDET
jgi:hypothetical protein